jgi:hypothetical protein
MAKHGERGIVLPLTDVELSRFWSKVEKTKDCWNWIASKTDFGYGQLTLRMRVCRAHGVAYMIFHGYIPKNRVVHHACENPACVNPDHLEIVTHKKNIQFALLGKPQLWRRKIRHKALERPKPKNVELLPSIWPESLARKFWLNVKKSSGCWIWTGYIMSNGYGQLKVGKLRSRNLRNLLAHRLVYELTYGMVPKGLCVLHKCDNRRCVRPSHLWLGTKRDNTLDMHFKGRARSCWKRRISNLKIKRIRFLANRGVMTFREIGEVFGVSTSLVSMIYLGKSRRFG